MNKATQQNQHSHAKWFLKHWANKPEARKPGYLYKHEFDKETVLEHINWVGTSGKWVKRKVSSNGFIAFSDQLEKWFSVEIDYKAMAPTRKLINGLRII